MSSTGYLFWLHLLTHLAAQDNLHVSISSRVQINLDELTSSFVAVLFIDALQRMVRIAQEGEQLPALGQDDELTC